MASDVLLSHMYGCMYRLDKLIRHVHQTNFPRYVTFSMLWNITFVLRRWITHRLIKVNCFVKVSIKKAMVGLLLIRRQVLVWSDVDWFYSWGEIWIKLKYTRFQMMLSWTFETFLRCTFDTIKSLLHCIVIRQFKQRRLWTNIFIKLIVY